MHKNIQKKMCTLFIFKNNIKHNILDVNTADEKKSNIWLNLGVLVLWGSYYYQGRNQKLTNLTPKIRI